MELLEIHTLINFIRNFTKHDLNNQVGPGNKLLNETNSSEYYSKTSNSIVVTSFMAFKNWIK